MGQANQKADLDRQMALAQAFGQAQRQDQPQEITT